MPDRAIFRAVRDTVFQGNVDLNHVSLEATILAQAYVDRLKSYRASIRPRSRRSR